MVGYNDELCDIKVWKKRSPYFIKAGPPEAKKYPGFNPRQVETPDGLIIEYDVAVPMRDGVKMYIDIYRPANQPKDVKIPIVIAWTPVSPSISWKLGLIGSMENIIPHRLRRFRSIRALMLRD
jgi:predicted acyl esterase